MTWSQRRGEARRAAGDGVEETPVQARQAVKTRHMRWVLAVSLVLCVAALGGAWLWYVTAQPPSRVTPAAMAAKARTPTGGGVAVPYSMERPYNTSG